ncbi:UNVERIFIED_CONTAM: hypothetical protein FKN15_041729 [Acipenser sinensis]
MGIEAPQKIDENAAESFSDSSLFAHWGQDLSPENRRTALKKFQYYGYNAYLSDRLSVDRSIPDLRPDGSPALIGCFVVDRQYFEEIGLLDEGMEVYGGENVELGIRVWQCGGSVEVLPCSRIAHIERAHKPYTEDLTGHVRRNALRVAEVWMDEFKSHVYMAWNIPQEDSGIDIGDISERKALRKRLQCKTFRWYLVNVYSEMRMYTDTIAYGVLKNSLKSDLCLDQGPDTDNIPIVYMCHGMTPQNVYYTGSQQLHVGVLSPTVDDDDNKCLVDVNSKPKLIECSYAKAKRMKLYWLFTQWAGHLSYSNRVIPLI